jgi:hypothetical protein
MLRYCNIIKIEKTQHTVTHAKHWVSPAWLLKVPDGQASQRREEAFQM